MGSITCFALRSYNNVHAGRLYFSGRKSAMFQSICEIIYVVVLLASIFPTAARADDENEPMVEYQIATSPDAFLVYENTHYFEITSPEILSYTYKLRKAKDFGEDFSRVYRNIPLKIANPIDGCRPLTNTVRNAVAMVMRGGCSFLTKSKHVEHAGAVAAIIADNNEDNDEHMVDMVDDSTGRIVGIPSLFLLGKDGVMIRRQLANLGLDEAIITIPVNLTGLPLGQAHQPPWILW